MTGRLLDAAESLYALEGPRALTNRRIAEAANTTTQAIYTYFGGRDQLIDAMWRRAVDGVSDLLSNTLGLNADTSAPDQPDEVVAALFEAAHSYRTYCLHYPGRFRLLQRAGADNGTPPDANELREKVFSHLATFGEKTSNHPPEVYPSRVRLSLASINGLIQAEIDGFVTAGDQPELLLNELIYRFLTPVTQPPSLPYPVLA